MSRVYWFLASKKTQSPEPALFRDIYGEFRYNSNPKRDRKIHRNRTMTKTNRLREIDWERLTSDSQSVPPTATGRSKADSSWLEPMMAIGLLLVIAEYAAVQAFGDLGTPQKWSSLEEIAEHLRPLPVQRWTDVLANLLRYAGIFGDAGYGLLFITFGAKLSLIRLANPVVSNLGFAASRSLRILPIWWTAHIVFLLPPAIVGWHVSLAHPEFYWSSLGVRVFGSQVEYGFTGWWFVGSLIQFCFVFPWLFHWLLVNPQKRLLSVVFLGVAIRVLGLLLFEDYFTPWRNGALFASRLSEYALGIWIGISCSNARSGFDKAVRHHRTCLLAGAGVAISAVASFTVLGTSIAPFLMSASLFCLIFYFRKYVERMPLRVFLFVIGRHYLSIFLVHRVIIPRVVLPTTPPVGLELYVRILVALFLTATIAIVLECVAEMVELSVPKMMARVGGKRFAKWCISCITIFLGVIVILELQVRKHDPQDVADFGWAERPALAPHPQLGITFKPRSQTRLRWDSYDYIVEANSHGFPGPEFELEKPRDRFRVLTLGDSFTSANGVDTSLAWPRRLERRLRQSQLQDWNGCDVINLAVSGYGPTQYAWLAQEYVPTLRPNVIIIGFFTNEFDDVQLSAEQVQARVRFQSPDPECLLGYLSGRHLVQYIRSHVVDPIWQDFTKRPSKRVANYCQVESFRRSALPEMRRAQALIRGRFARIKEAADSVNARVIIAAIPASTQVADRDDLQYWPSFLRFEDGTRYDMDQPQRLTRELAYEFDFQFIDLRDTLTQAQEQGLTPYSPHNLNWNSVGHDLMANKMLSLLTDD